jgi:hypothetical protein
MEPGIVVNRSRMIFVAGVLLALAAALIGQQLSGHGATAAGAPVATKAAKLQLVSDSSLQLSSPNESPRAVALCPGGQEPYGGGIRTIPGPDAEGEGVYPHSYERLGAQSGFHTTPVLYDPTPLRTTRSYQVTLQVLCTKKFGKVADPHAIKLDVPTGTSVTLVATCPKKSVLIGGGFQRAAFELDGGVYPTESHAISKTQWQASGTAFGTIKNDMVSIGYCMASPKRKALLTEVTASVAIQPQTTGVVTTPPCTGGRKMLYNGFDTNPKTGVQQGTFFSDGYFNPDQTFTASAYNGGSVPSTLTAYGYCMKNAVIGGSLKKFTKKIGALDENSKTKQDEG